MVQDIGTVSVDPCVPIECLRGHIADQVKSAPSHREKTELRIAVGIHQLTRLGGLTEPSGRSQFRGRHVEALEGLATIS